MKIRLSVCLLSLLVVTAFLTGCSLGSSNPSDTSYWFSQHNITFTKYDFEDNINEAGTYWNFTSAKTVDITLNVRVDIDSYSALSLSQNGAVVQGQEASGIYTNSFKLSLKKGDKLQMHAYWTNSAKTNENGFEIQLLSITCNGQTYSLKEFDKSSSTP